MPIINLTINGKRATGDDTKIVCMNSDYTVRITFIDCDALVNLPVKKLVVRYGKEYKETDIKDVSVVDGQVVSEVKLPAVECQTYAGIGVYGKETDDPLVEPSFATTPARFECDKSVLCGTAIKKTDPKLTSLEINDNGTYNATDFLVDGFYKIDVNVVGKYEETQTVDLFMPDGDQVINPTNNTRIMSQVIVTKPMNLIPENIRKGINIGGVTGAYGSILKPLTVVSNGEYTPEEGADGFSRVTVAVPVTVIPASPKLQDKIVTENGEVTADIGYDGLAKVTVAVPSGADDSALPIEVSTEAEMTELLTVGEVGSVYKYTGTTGIYENSALYVLEATDEPDEPDTPEPEPEPEPDEPDEPEVNNYITIGGTHYGVVGDRMTWYEWCKNMNCNTDNFQCLSENGYVYEADSENVVTDANGTEVLGSNTIVAGGEYKIKKHTFTFTIVGRTSEEPKETYSVEDGTTWSGWIAGNGLEWYSVESGTDYVYASEPRIAYILNSNGNIVKGSEPITEGGVYKVEAEDALEGTWVFNDTVNLSPLTSDTEFKINFTFGANDTEGTAIQILGGDYVQVDYESYDEDEGEYAFGTVYYGLNGWYVDTNKTIHITTKFDDLTYTVGNSLLAWLEANATKQ